MIITDVTTVALRYPMDTPMADAIHYMPDRPTLLVQVHTDEGSELQLRYCTNCLRHNFHLAVQQRNSKNDWKTVPNSEVDVETPPHFQTSFVAA